MKKTYMNPTMEVLMFKSVQHLLSGSTLNMKSGQATEWGAREMDFDEETE